jgi:elongation factor Ts
METAPVSFTAKDVMALRQRTGLGMMDCKKALTATNGDIKAAEEWLREKLKGKMDKRTERATGQGRIGVAVDGSRAAVVEVLTETDFTARNENFVAMVEDVARSALDLPPGPITASPEITKRIDDVRITTGENANFSRGERLDGGTFGCYVHHDGKRACLIQVEGDADAGLLKGICQHIVFHDPMAISESEVSAETMERIRTEAIAEAVANGKPEQIAQKISEGKVRKYLQENTLLNQKFVLDESKMVQEVLPQGTSIRRFIRYTIGG